jgi:outer membrane protein TolC
MVAEVEIEDIPDGLDLPQAGSMRLDLWHQLPNRARTRAQRSVAEVEREAAALTLSAAERWIEARLNLALLQGSGGARIAQRLAAEDSLLAETEVTLRERFAVAGARYLDVLRLRTERLRLQADLHAARTTARIARQELIAIAGLPQVSAAALVDSALAEALRTDPRALLTEELQLDSLVASAVAVKNAALVTRGAQLASDLVRANQRPDIAAGLGLQRYATESGGHAVGPTIGLSISLPFTANRSNRLAGETAALQITAAETAEAAATARIRATITIRSERYNALRERLALFDTALLAGAAEERETALSAYRNGTITLLDFLDFERSLRGVEIEVLQLRIAAASTLLDLFAALLAPGTDESDSLDGGSDS